MTENAQNADFRRKPQIFADSPLLLEIQAFGGRRKPQKTADFRRKPKIFAETVGNRRLASVTLGASPLARPYLFWQPTTPYSREPPWHSPESWRRSPTSPEFRWSCLLYVGGPQNVPKVAMSQKWFRQLQFCFRSLAWSFPLLKRQGNPPKC